MSGFIELPPKARREESQEQVAWRDTRMYGANAFIAGLETAGGMGRISEGEKIATLRSFISAVFEVPLRDDEKQVGTFRADVKRPDGIVIRAVISSDGSSGLHFIARFVNLNYDGTEPDVADASIEETANLYDIARGIAY